MREACPEPVEGPTCVGWGGESAQAHWGGGAVALLLAFSMLTGATKPPTELDVSRLRILDGNGKVRAILGVTEDGPILALFDANG